MAAAAGPAGAGAGVAPDFVWWVICQGKLASTRGRARGRNDINCPKTDGIDAEFVTAQIEASDSTHPAWNTEWGPGFAEVLQFLHGADTSADLLPILHELRIKTECSSNVETQIERDHAELHQFVQMAHHVSEAYASIAMRRHEIVRWLERSPESAFRFSHVMSGVRDPRACVTKLGLLAHLSIREWVDEDMWEILHISLNLNRPPAHPLLAPPPDPKLGDPLNHLRFITY